MCTIWQNSIAMVFSGDSRTSLTDPRLQVFAHRVVVGHHKGGTPFGIPGLTAAGSQYLGQTVRDVARMIHNTTQADLICRCAERDGRTVA